MLNFEKSPTSAENFTDNQELKEQINQKITDSDPRLIKAFTPKNAEVAREEFLENDRLLKPNAEYGTPIEKVIELNKINDEVRELIKNPSLGKNEAKLYELNVNDQQLKIDLLGATVVLNDPDSSPEEIAEAERIFMKANVEAYGKPEAVVFESLLRDKLNKITDKPLDARGQRIFAELKASLSKDYQVDSSSERFRPDEELFKDFGDLVRIFYAEQLAVVPESPKPGDKFSAEEIFETFEKVIATLEDGTDFSQFKVVWKETGAVSVNSADREIRIPRDRKPIEREKLEGLIVHEIGAHYYRSQIGEDFGVEPMRLGLPGYLDSEEGIARAMEMAVVGKYEESGVKHYLTAGLAYLEGKNFRETFEAKWRLGVLESSKDGVITDEAISKARIDAYNDTQRIFRGTGELPWFKDLSYYNGGVKVWEFISKHRDDPELFDKMLLYGKSNILDRAQSSVINNFKWNER